VTPSAGTLPPTASQLLEDGAPHPEALRFREAAGFGQPVPASAGTEPVLRDEPWRQRGQREARGLCTGASLSALPPPVALSPEEEHEDEPAAACG